MKRTTLFPVLQATCTTGGFIVVMSLVGGVWGTFFSSELMSPITVAPEQSLVVDVAASQPQGQTYGEVRVKVLETSDSLVRYVVMAREVALGGLFVLGLVLVVRMLGDADRQEAFRPRNARRMQWLAWVALGVLAVNVLGAPITTWAQDRLGSSAIFVSTSFLPALVAVVVFALARLWLRAAELQDLEDRTI